MGRLARIMTSAAAIFGAVMFSQAPEFAQQYRQRLGGALDELRVIVADFDRDAHTFKLDRKNALALFAASDKDFLRARGESMRSTLSRYDKLSMQAVELSEAPPFMKPFIVLSNPDPMIVENVWKDFVPAMPVSISGGGWAVIGALLFGCFTGLTSLFGRRKRGAARSTGGAEGRA